MASTNSASVIWVVGEAAGVDQNGATASPPAEEDASEQAAIQAELDALEARLVASGVLPN